MGFFSKLKEGLTKTRDNIVSGIDSVFSGFSSIDDDFYDELEETLIMGDIGVVATEEILDDLKAKVKENKIKNPADCKQLLIDSIKEKMDLGENAYEFENRKSIVMLIGVNGVGKTTSVGKLAGLLKAQNKKVIMAAADTFRAAAIEQLTEWSNRTGADIIAQIAKLPNIMIEGIFTHFARADELSKEPAFEQFDLFKRMIALVEARGVEIPIKHCSNSAGIVEIPECNMDMVRAGITLYGLWPSDEVDKSKISLKPVMSLHSRVAYVKELEPGRHISYGGTFTVEHHMRIATVPVGYGDGYSRGLSNKGWVLIKGKKAPICGRVCMDQFMVDVTDIPDVKIGDAVTLLGKEGDETITMEQLGELSGRFNYEFACLITPRVPRIYHKN